VEPAVHHLVAKPDQELINLSYWLNIRGRHIRHRDLHEALPIIAFRPWQPCGLCPVLETRHNETSDICYSALAVNLLHVPSGDGTGFCADFFTLYLSSTIAL
jgi:hypothetical protein